MSRGISLNLSFKVPKKTRPSLSDEVRVAAYSVRTDRGKYMTPDEAEEALNDFVGTAMKTINALRLEHARQDSRLAQAMRKHGGKHGGSARR